MEETCYATLLFATMEGLFWHLAVKNGISLKEYPMMVSDVSLEPSVPL